MAQFCVAIADEDVERVIEALCDTYGRKDVIDNPNFDFEQEESQQNPKQISNPETPNQYANRMVRNFISEVTVSHEANTLRRQIQSPIAPDISDPVQ